MKAEYTCTICGWSKICDSIVDFNIHASNEHESKFFKEVTKNYRLRNDLRLRDFVEIRDLRR